METFTKVGLDALLTPENCVLLLIDHQPFQLANVNSHDPTIVINNVTALAKTAKAYGIPTILTTVNEERGGLIFKQVQAVFPDQKTINRTFINCWEDRRVVEAVKKTGRKKLVMAALWTEMCLSMPAIHAMGDGYDVYVVTDASGGVSPEAWHSAAWWLPELNPLPGLAWRENFSVTGRAQSTLEKSLSFLSTMPALLVLCSCGRRSC
jgi:nicotinamidase-related amidase